MAPSSQKSRGGGRVPAGAWHVVEAVWGGVQRVRLVTGPPSLVSDPDRIRSIHAVGFLRDGAEGDSDVLLVQNRDGTWTFPGGRLEEQETVDQALAREVWEEARARMTAGYAAIAATRIEFLNRVPGRVHRVHPSFLVWVAADVSELSDEPHHDPADCVACRRVMTVTEARALLPALEQRVLDAAIEYRQR